MIIKTLHKTAWLTGGIIFLVLAIIGLLLPIIPQMPFFLISAFCFIRCSPRFNNWLSHQHWFANFHDWAQKKNWFKPINKHLPRPQNRRQKP